mmetsp:Transcript_12949/g.20766  ORF Transcript_12949/g.20766 Transcript_12949/m.20766 type:complete len:408 (+) Transcript_12949:69-1292(+)
MASGSSRLLRSIVSFPVRKPLIFGLGFSCVKTSFADLLVQKFVEKRTEIDWRRNSAFGLFGLLYLGGVQYFLYVPVFRRLFPNAEAFATKPVKEKLKDTTGQLTMLKQVFLDQCIHHPFFYFPSFYAMKEIVVGGKLQDAKKKYQRNFKDDIFALWKIWVPATMVNFTFMPMWGRIPFVASTSLVWTCILSYMRGSDPIDNHNRVAEVWGNQGRALSMVLSKRAQLKNTMGHLVITSCGDSKAALTSLSQSLCDAGGNIVRSSAFHVCGETVVTMVVETNPDNVPRIVSTLQTFEGASITLNKLLQAKVHDNRFECSLQVKGKDRPGILTEVSKFLDEMDIRVESFVQGNTTSSLETGNEDLFCLRLVLSSSCNLNLDTLQESLSDYGNKRGISMILFPHENDHDHV